MKQYLGERKLRSLRKKTGLAIVEGRIRGGTGHLYELLLESGNTVCVDLKKNIIVGAERIGEYEEETGGAAHDHGATRDGQDDDAGAAH